MYIGNCRTDQLAYIPVAAVSSSSSASLSAIVIYQCYICNMYIRTYIHICIVSEKNTTTYEVSYNKIM